MPNTSSLVLLVVGSPAWTDRAVILRAIADLAPAAVVVGDACGAETLAAEAAEALGFKVTRYLVLREDGPRPGGLEARDERMVKEARPDRGLALGPIWKRRRAHGKRCRFGYDLTLVGKMVRRLLALRKPVRWIPGPDEAPVDLVRMPESPDVARWDARQEAVEPIATDPRGL